MELELPSFLVPEGAYVCEKCTPIGSCYFYFECDLNRHVARSHKKSTKINGKKRKRIFYNGKGDSYSEIPPPKRRKLAKDSIEFFRLENEKDLSLYVHDLKKEMNLEKLDGVWVDLKDTIRKLEERIEFMEGAIGELKRKEKRKEKKMSDMFSEIELGKRAIQECKKDISKKEGLLFLINPTFHDMEKKIKELENANKKLGLDVKFYKLIIDNVVECIKAFPKNSPYRRSLIAYLLKNLQEKKRFECEILCAAGLSPEYRYGVTQKDRDICFANTILKQKAKKNGLTMSLLLTKKFRTS